MALDSQPAATPVIPTGPIEETRQPRASSTKLEDQAALAALYVTKYDNSVKSGQNLLGSDHKLSSAGQYYPPGSAGFQ